jgi:hypothetical protein
MSDTDSFIDEVNEEVRRDRLYHYLRRYGWIAVLLILLIVGGAAWNEYQKASARAEAEALGDGMLAALSLEDAEARATALAEIEPANAEGRALLGLLEASEMVEAGNTEAAVAALDGISVNPDVPPIYRSIAQFKALTLQAGTTDPAERRLALEAMAQPGQPLRLLALEQLALLDIETGETESAIETYQSILSDAGVSTDLQQRALQVIVALGGEPELSGAADTGAELLPDAAD